MQAEITVRRVRAEEWERLRATRLRALADAPMAFGSTLADEQTRPDDEVSLFSHHGAQLSSVLCSLPQQHHATRGGKVGAAEDSFATR